MKASLCVGRYATTPYCIEGIEVLIYSMEELCYCIRENAFLIDVSLMNDGLLEWIDRECGLRELVRILNPLVHKAGSLSAFVTAIMEYVGFYGPGEILQVEQTLKRGAGLSRIERQKKLIDQLAAQKKYSKALQGYDALLAKWQQAPLDGAVRMLPAPEVKASILYNRGTVYTSLFLYNQAAEDFWEAWQTDRREEYMLAFLAARRLELPEDEYIGMTANLPESFEASLALEKKLDELKIDWRGSVEYRVINIHPKANGPESVGLQGGVLGAPYEMSEEVTKKVSNEEILLQSLKESYRSSINYRDSRREQ